jgi:uncharacterized protein
LNIVVTGATGFIGRPLCAELARLGHAISALTRNAESARNVLVSSAACIAWGRDAPTEPWQRAVGESDAVIHLAGQSVAAKAWTPQIRDELRRSRIETTRGLVDAMRVSARRPGAFVCASGINYYGDRGDEELSEDSEPGHTFLAELCVEWEREAAKAEDLGVRVVRHRAGIVLERGGPLDKILYPLPAPISPWMAGLGGRIGSGRQWLPWIHLDDAVGMFIWSATDSRVSGAVNTVAPELVRNSDFTRALSRAIRRPAVLPIPAFALRLIVGGFADELVTSQRAVPAAAAALGFQYKFPRLDDALNSIFRRRI